MYWALGMWLALPSTTCTFLRVYLVVRCHASLLRLGTVMVCQTILRRVCSMVFSTFLSFFIGHLREMEQLSNLNLNQTPAEEILCHPTLIKPLPILWKRDQGLVANISLLRQCCKMKNLPWMQKCFVWCMKWDKKDNCKTCFGVFIELLSTQFVNVAFYVIFTVISLC